MVRREVIHVLCTHIYIYTYIYTYPDKYTLYSVQLMRIVVTARPGDTVPSCAFLDAIFSAALQYA